MKWWGTLDTLGMRQDGPVLQASSPQSESPSKLQSCGVQSHQHPAKPTTRHPKCKIYNPLHRSDVQAPSLMSRSVSPGSVRHSYNNVSPTVTPYSITPFITLSK